MRTSRYQPKLSAKGDSSLSDTAFAAIHNLSDRWLSGRLAIRWRGARVKCAPRTCRSWLTSPTWANSQPGQQPSGVEESDNNAEPIGPRNSSWPMMMMMMIATKFLCTYYTKEDDKLNGSINLNSCLHELPRRMAKEKSKCSNLITLPSYSKELRKRKSGHSST